MRCGRVRSGVGGLQTGILDDFQSRKRAELMREVGNLVAREVDGLQMDQ